MGALLILILALFVLGFLISGYERGVHRVRLRGPMDEPANWLPEAVQASARGGLVGWTSEVSADLGDGSLLGFHAVLRSSQGDTILVDVPDFPPGDHTEDPVVATVAIGDHTLSGVRGAQLFKLPAQHVMGRRRRVCRQLRKHARRSMRHR